MELEFWWLLALPLFFALGWLAARVDIKQLLSESRTLPMSYFKGLNFLLNEQPDKAIDAFIEVVKVDPQTIELHFAQAKQNQHSRRHRPLRPCQKLDSWARMEWEAKSGQRRLLLPVSPFACPYKSRANRCQPCRPIR